MIILAKIFAVLALMCFVLAIVMMAAIATPSPGEREVDGE